MKHIYKRLLAAALTFVIVLALLPTVALAEGTNIVADFAESTVTIRVIGEDQANVTYRFGDSGDLTEDITLSTDTVTVTGNNSKNMSNQIVVYGNSNYPDSRVNVILDNVVGLVSGPVMLLKDNANVELALVGDSTFTVGGMAASTALVVPDGCKLTIDGAGTLTAKARDYGAGIGGDWKGSVGTIIINGGTIDAQGGLLGAGIGSGYQATGSAGTIIINGGTVTARSSQNGAGIGGGSGSPGGSITINGGIVTASSNGAGGTTSDGMGAGIGGGNGGASGTITINGGTVTAYSGSLADKTGGGSGIGSGFGAGAIESTVVINGGNILARTKIGATAYSIDNPKDSDGNDLYLAPLTLEDAGGNANVTAGSLNGYGLEDVQTFDGGALYLWLPEQTGTNISITSGGTVYAGTLSVSNEGITSITLGESSPPDITSLGTSSLLLESTGGSAIITVSGTDLSDGITVTAFDGEAETAISGTALGSAIAQGVSLTFPANDCDADKAYTVKASLDGGTTWDDETCTVTVKKPVAVVPAITGLFAVPDELGSVGDISIVTVSGTDLPDGITVTAFDGDGATGITGTTEGEATAQAVTLTFPANSGDTDQVYTVKASLDGGTTWDDETCTVTVQKKTAGSPPVGGGGPVTHTITLIPGGDLKSSILRVTSGGTLEKPADPTREGYTFLGWFIDVDGKMPYDFTKKVTSGFTLYAGWEKDGETEPEKPAWQNPFTDVSENAWYFEAVRYAAENGIMNGTSATTFAPGISLSRAMLVQILYNLEGRPDAGSSAFNDVDDGAWYADAVAWAAANDIVGGMGNGLFAPDGDITREQMALMLYNYCKYKGITLPNVTDAAITDAKSVSDWALEAVQAMYESGILRGKDGGVFDPKGKATRAEVAQMIMNFMEAIK